MPPNARHASEATQVAIRPATSGDAAYVTDLIAALLREIMERCDVPFFQAEETSLAQQCESMLERGVATFLLAWTSESDRPIGVAALSECFALYAGGSYGIITELYVQPGFRNAGVGAMLVRTAKEHARHRGWTRLEVTTPPLPQFQASLSFYERHGFTITGGLKLKSSM
jgi:GNAT superfamily N-acetyltransferase